jgi:hypothetical protein
VVLQGIPPCMNARRVYAAPMGVVLSRSPHAKTANLECSWESKGLVS